MMSPRRALAVVDEGRPERGRREGDAVDQDVVADEQGVLHGGGGDFEVLEDEGHDEEADGEDGADGGEGFECGLVVFGPGLGRGFQVSLRLDLFGGGGGSNFGQLGSPRRAWRARDSVSRVGWWRWGTTAGPSPSLRSGSG